MKNKIEIKNLVLGVFLGAVVVYSVAAATRGVRTGWEYTTVSGRVTRDELETATNQTVATGLDFVSASRAFREGNNDDMTRVTK